MKSKPLNQIYPGLAVAFTAIEDTRRAFVAEVEKLPTDADTVELLGQLADVDESLAKAERDFGQLFSVAFAEVSKDWKPAEERQ